MTPSQQALVKRSKAVSARWATVKDSLTVQPGTTRNRLDVTPSRISGYETPIRAVLSERDRLVQAQPRSGVGLHKPHDLAGYPFASQTPISAPQGDGEGESAYDDTTSAKRTGEGFLAFLGIQNCKRISLSGWPLTATLAAILAFEVIFMLAGCGDKAKVIDVPAAPLTTTAPVDLAAPVKAQGDVAAQLTVSAGQARHAAVEVRRVVPEAVKPAIEPSAKEMETVAASNDAGAKALTVSRGQTAEAQGLADAKQEELNQWKARSDALEAKAGAEAKRAEIAEKALADSKSKWIDAMHWALIAVTVGAICVIVYAVIVKSLQIGLVGGLGVILSMTLNVYAEKIAFWGVIGLGALALGAVAYFIFKAWRDQQSKEALVELNQVQKANLSPEAKAKIFGMDDDHAWKIMPDHTILEVDKIMNKLGMTTPTPGVP